MMPAHKPDKMKMAKEALKIWMRVPDNIRSTILSKVWCGQCGKAVTMCDYNAGFSKGTVVLRGFCSTCGHKAARFLEGYEQFS